jgi:dihydrofolate synthase/folylpolyglutamate synthase
MSLSTWGLANGGDPQAVTYTQAVQELEALGIMPDAMPSLEPMRRALARSGLSIPRARNVIIAGTNDKGTTAATLHSLLLTQSPRVGLYTSPHLISTRERIRLGAEDLSEADFVRAYLALRPIVAAERLTHFEALTLIAAHVFFSGDFGPRVDYAIWEVGLGGMFDATNAIPHLHGAITRLGLDHQNILGQTLPEIARQKFGVIGARHEGTVARIVYSPMPDSLAPLRAEIAAQTGCEWIPARPGDLPALPPVLLPGARARENFATALTLYAALGFDARAALPALGQVRWPGRFSLHSDARFPCPVFLSGDHNPDGVESLLEILAEVNARQPWRELHLVVGIGRDKDAGAMLERLLSLPRARLYLTETPFKPLPLSDYPAHFRSRAEGCEADCRVLLTRLAPRTSPDGSGASRTSGRPWASSTPRTPSRSTRTSST